MLILLNLGGIDSLNRTAPTLFAISAVTTAATAVATAAQTTVFNGVLIGLFRGFCPLFKDFNRKNSQIFLFFADETVVAFLRLLLLF